MDILKNKIIGLQSAKTPEKGIESIYALVRAQGDGCILSTKFAYPSRNYCDAAFEICFGIAEGCPDVYFSDGCGGFLSLRAEKNICDNQWHRLFAALDRKAGRLSIFIDGCDAAQKDFDPEKLGDIKLRAPILLGHEFDNMINHKNVFRGEIAAACLWSTAVNAEEAENLALRENMIACWKPKESLADLSGNGMELTPYKYFIGRESEEFERYSAPACEGEYTIAFIPDTQTTMFRKELKEQHFKCIYDWLIANRERYNIKMVMGLGDVTEHSSRETNQEFDEPRIAMGRSEWALAKGQFDRLTKANIPWTVILGNHDYGTGGTGRRESLLFDEAFPYDEISRFAHFGGAMDAPQSVLNAYYYLSEGGVDYLLLCLENEPREHTLKWANELIDNHPDHKVIITTHEAIGKDASYTKAMFVYDEEGNVVL
ncbi:MAG: metallophosphoesterase, partial [Clostridia bacterium]|nr:metallophosphoesterase [Clostridia bacterium]